MVTQKSQSEKRSMYWFNLNLNVKIRWVAEVVMVVEVVVGVVPVDTELIG